VRPAVLIGLGWALLITAWIGGNPPFAGADEQWHYARAIGVGQGEFVGAEATARLGANPLQVAWTNQATRSVSMPGGLAPPSAGCYIFDPRTPATCLNAFRSPAQESRFVTPVGTYEPLPYLLPAVAMEPASTPRSALMLGRIASALAAGALLLMALALLRDSLLGLVVAVTPMVLFSVSLLNGSGMEIAAAIAFAAALSRRSWGAVALSGAVLALSRSAGPVWVVLIGLLFQGWKAPRRTLAIVGVAIVANRVWEAIYGPHLMLGVANARHTIVPAFEEWWRASIDLVGKFGYLEIHVPLWTALLWLGLLAALIAPAIRADRVRVGAAVLTALVFPPLFWLVQYRHTGFDLQGRHMLPLLVALPILCGELAPRNTTRRLLPVALAITALVQFVAWYVNARRSAVGTGGPLFFLDDAKWSPAGGWLPWVVLAALGSIALLGAAVTSLGKLSYSGRLPYRGSDERIETPSEPR
jgi:hypothetical protein